MQVHKDHIRIAKVVGENEDGLTLFVPKNEEGTFHLTDGDKFLTIMFCRHDPSDNTMEIWIPWYEGNDND